jgi:hypothetical protein
VAGARAGRPKSLRARADGTALSSRTRLSAAERLAKVTGDDPSWSAWRVFLKGLEGEHLSPSDRAIWSNHASAEPREGVGFAEAVCCVGRRAGKSTVAAVLAVNAALNARPPAHAEQHVVAMAQTETNARRVLFAMAQSITESDVALRRRLREEPKRGELAFDTGTRLVTLPCVPSALRGYASPLVVLDELGFYEPDESIEAVRAARPCLATVPGSRLVIISSPGAAVGALYDMTEKPGADTLVWRASAPDMNPSLPRDYLERMRISDPVGYRAEVLGEFVAGVSTLLAPEAIEACARSDAAELRPRSGVRYRAFADMSGGRHDAATFAVGHLDDDGAAVVDVLRRVEPPFSPADAVDEFVSVAHDYAVHKVVGDQYGAALNADLWTERGVRYEPCRFNRSALYLSLVGPVNQRRIRLPRSAVLMRELRELMRRKTRAGRESVDHPMSGSDDAANAVAGVVFLLLKRRADPLATWSGWMMEERDALAVAAA